MAIRHSALSQTMKISILLLAFGCFKANAFIPRNPTVLSTELFEVIRGDAVDTPMIDAGQGGVRLAQESAVKITGEVRHKPGSAESRALDLIRYTELTKVDESRVKEILGKIGGKIISIGKGSEIYKDPGDTLDSIIKLSPMEAIKDAVNGAASAIDEKELVVNFLGGDDLILGEVLDATNELVVMMDIATKAKITLNSMSHSSMPSGTCTVSVISVSESETKFSGVDDSIAAGEVYVRDGVWYTVDKVNINTAIA